MIVRNIGMDPRRRKRRRIHGSEQVRTALHELGNGAATDALVRTVAEPPNVLGQSSPNAGAGYLVQAGIAERAPDHTPPPAITGTEEQAHLVDAPAGSDACGFEPVSIEKPHINICRRQLRDIGADALSAMRCANKDEIKYYQRNGKLVWVKACGTKTPIISGMQSPDMLHELTRVADWYAYDGRKEVDTIPPTYVVNYVRAADGDELAQFPELKGIVTAPHYAIGGVFCGKAGYNPTSRLYLHGVSMEPPPVGLDDLEWAKAFITNELFGDFPFKSNADMAHAVALVLLPFVRPMIDGPTPIHLIEAPRHECGKSLLMKVACIPFIGKEPTVITSLKDDVEAAKKILSALLQGSSHVAFDDVSTLGGDSVAGAITAYPDWQDRKLGVSEMVPASTEVTWAVTGNNIEIMRPDIARRCIQIRLDPGTELPEPRSGFRHPELPTWAKENRNDLVKACLTIIEAWRCAGKKDWSGLAKGSFERWSAIMGGILEHACIDGFLVNDPEFRKSHAGDTDDWKPVFLAWYGQFGDRPVEVRDVMPIAEEFVGHMVKGQGVHRANSLGKLLIKKVDNVFEDPNIGRVKLVCLGMGSSHRQLWRIQLMEGPAAKPEDRPDDKPKNSDPAPVDMTDVAVFGFPPYDS